MLLWFCVYLMVHVYQAAKICFCFLVDSSLVPGLSAISRTSTADQHGQGDSMRHPVWPQRIPRYCGQSLCVAFMFCQDHAVEACWTQINWLLFSAPGFDSCYGLLHDDYCCLCLATWQGRKGRRSPFFIVTFHHRGVDVDTDWPWLLVTPLEGPHPWMWYASNGLKSESGIEHLQVEFACPCSIPLLWFLLLWCPCNGISTTILTDGRLFGEMSKTFVYQHEHVDMPKSQAGW